MRMVSFEIDITVWQDVLGKMNEGLLFWTVKYVNTVEEEGVVTCEIPKERVKEWMHKLAPSSKLALSLYTDNWDEYDVDPDEDPDDDDDGELPPVEEEYVNYSGLRLAA